MRARIRKGTRNEPVATIYIRRSIFLAVAAACLLIGPPLAAQHASGGIHLDVAAEDARAVVITEGVDRLSSDDFDFPPNPKVAQPIVSRDPSPTADNAGER